MIIDILITTSGFLGLLLTILAIFFKPSKIKEVPVKPLVIIIMWLALMVLGFVNLYYTIKCDGGNPGGPEDSLKKNYKLIQKLKASYSEADTKIIENDEVEFRIIEKAGIIYENLEKTGRPDLLAGAYVSSAKVIILDYFSDNKIYEYDSKGDIMRYVPANHDKFYCVVVHNDYDLYVTPPIQVIGGERYNDVDIYLDKKGISYTPLSQIRLCVQNSKSDESHSSTPSDYIVRFNCTSINNGGGYLTYVIDKIPNSGILSCGKCSYFSLNTDYKLDISLYHQADDTSQLAHQTYDGSFRDSNSVAEIIFELDNENDASE